MNGERLAGRALAIEFAIFDRGTIQLSIITCRSHMSWSTSKRLEGRSTEIQVSYIGGWSGEWRVTKMQTHSGAALKSTSHVHIKNGTVDRTPLGTAWVLSGVVSNSRYVAREDRDPFDSPETSYSRAEADCAVLIPIRKSLDWWDLAKFDRTQIVEARSRLMSRLMRFFPAAARRIHQGRGLSEQFDFVTWFEFSRQDMPIFDDMLGTLRSSEEWHYVEREIEIRMERA